MGNPELGLHLLLRKLMATKHGVSESTAHTDALHKRHETDDAALALATV
jgi:hypothetical protein